MTLRNKLYKWRQQKNRDVGKWTKDRGDGHKQKNGRN